MVPAMVTIELRLTSQTPCIYDKKKVTGMLKCTYFTT